MFSLIIVIFAIMGAVAAIYMVSRSTNSGDRANWGFLSTVCFVGAAIWFIAATTGPSVSALQTINKVQVTKNDIKVAEHRRDKYTNTVHSILDSYPKYERTTFDSLHPEIVLSYPELKTNDVLKEEVSKILDANEQVFNLQQKLNGEKQAIKAVHDNPFAITFVWWPSS